MLYHLIQLNPNKDITLHVSANNPAMVNRVLIFFHSDLYFKMCVCNSSCTTALDLRQKNLSSGSTMITSILNRVHRRMRSDFDFVGDISSTGPSLALLPNAS